MSIWEAFGMGRHKGFSREAGLLLDEAVELAGSMGCARADTGHLLLAMLQTDRGPAGRFLAGKNITEPAVRRQLAESRRAPALHLDRYALAPDLKRTMDYAIIGAQNAHLNRAEPEHLLCAMLEDDGCTAGILLASMGVQLTDAVRECRQLSGQFVLPYQMRTTVSAPRGSRASDKYCRDLTRRAAERELDPVFCREAELDRMVEILCRRQKNNPCLIGEPGVGKTAIAEGLAQRIAAGDVPYKLRDKEVFLLDLTALVAGTQFRGQFEQRVKGLLSEVKAAGNVILFIDEIHTITSAGESEGAMNAGNILKPALSRGEIQVIGATTFNEYRKYIEKDQALERRFQPVRVEEPSVSDTLAVMNGIKHYYEEHHHVQVPADVLSAAVTLSERYITDRYLPDKAIDLLDEACACCNLAHPVISEYLEMQKELDGLRQEEADMESSDVNEAIDYEQVAERKTRIAKLEAELPAKQAAASEIKVTMDDVAKVIELWTGIPAVKIQETEFVKLAGLEAELKKKIIGQDEAVHLVAQAVKRSRADLSGRRRPASFIFVGPTGVGKTELVKQLAEQLFDGPDPLIRLDMSEYMEKYAVSRMIGSPPGYVGYEEAGQLTEKVRRRPYSVVLFDEIEKAHPDVMNILLQILDEGKINDAQGRTVDFSNTVICMTSNAGSSDQSAGSLGFNKSDAQRSEEKTRKALAQFLRPEFLGRVDEVIAFKPLTEQTLQGIAALMLDEYKPGMEAKGIAYSYTPAALKALVQKSQGGKFGARDLRRVIRKAVEDPAAERLIDGSLASGGTLVVDADENGEVVLK